MATVLPTAFHVSVVDTAPIAGQKPGTSGLRKQTRTFMAGHYLHNFVQSTFDVLPAAELAGSTLVVSGDGRCGGVWGRAGAGIPVGARESQDARWASPV